MHYIKDLVAELSSLVARILSLPFLLGSTAYMGQANIFIWMVNAKYPI